MTPVFCDRNAWETDPVVGGWINTRPDVAGELESGLFKMLAKQRIDARCDAAAHPRGDR
jgi:hypothetical protein